MSNQPTKGRLVQIAQSYTNGGDIRKLESGEFGLGLDEGQERLWIGSHSGNIQVVTERNISQLAVPDGSIGRAELDGEVNTLLDNISNVANIPDATTSQKGLMSSADKIKLNSIESGANNTVIVNNLTSLSATSALSAYQGKLLKDAIDNIGGGGGSTVAVVDNLTSTDTTSALSANQGRILKNTLDNKADKTTATASSNGLMSASDKQKLDNLGNSVTVVNTLTSTSTTNALSAYQGKVVNDNLTSHKNDTTSHITSSERSTWNAKASTSVATTSANGLMSASDKTKLNGIETGATKTTIVDNLTSTSTTTALSANQGRVLKALIDSSGGGISNIYQSGVTTGSSGTAFGQGTKATGTRSFAIGLNSTANGADSFAIGYNTIASGSSAVAMNDSNTASATNATAINYSNTASGQNSFALGQYNTSSGAMSIAGGNYTKAVNYGSVSFGTYNNMTLSSQNTYAHTADAFTIGNGTSSSRANAFRVKFNGSVYGLSAYNSSGADYAEMFEWLDGNIGEEDRVGYFVTLDGDKIRKANSTDTYILGIVSVNASVIGNSASEGWNEQYMRDEFGRVQYHYVDVEYEELDENGEKVTVIKNEYHPVYNPQYNPQESYIPRENRKEWDAIGLVGILLVRDDGTCKVNGYCKPNDDGIATKTIASSNIKYRVMKRVSDNIIQVLVK